MQRTLKQQCLFQCAILFAEDPFGAQTDNLQLKGQGIFLESRMPNELRRFPDYAKCHLLLEQSVRCLVVCAAPMIYIDHRPQQNN